MDEYGLAYNFASGWDGTNANSNQSGVEKARTGLAKYLRDKELNPLGESVRIADVGTFDAKDTDFIKNTQDMLAMEQTGTPTFKGMYTGILNSTGKLGTSSNVADFAPGSVQQAIWADDNGINLSDMSSGKDTSFLGMNPEQWGSALKMGQIGIGAGQLGLGLAGYFENKKTADKQRKLLEQQIESNRAEIDARKNYRSALEGFGLQSQSTRI